MTILPIIHFSIFSTVLLSQSYHDLLEILFNLHFHKVPMLFLTVLQATLYSLSGELNLIMCTFK